jgi:hypothetical protein
MKYKQIEFEFYGVTEKHILIDNEDGSFTSFPVDNQNPNYIAFLAQLEADK